MKEIKKKCICGNIITVTLTKISHNQYNRKVDGSINMDFNNTALCTCFKVHNFNRAISAWWKINKG